MNNGDFRKLFSESMNETARLFNPENSFAVLDELVSLYGPLAADGYIRFGPEWIFEEGSSRDFLQSYFNNGIDEIKQFLKDRYDYYPKMMEHVLSSYQ